MKNNMRKPILKVECLDAWYLKDKFVLKKLGLDLYSNECVGLIGLNGAGKTTFMKIVAGLHSFYSCTAKTYNDKDVDFRLEEFKLKRYISFADENAFGYLTFNEYLDYVLKSYKKICPDISHLIKGFHFENYTDALIKELSTGNKKKVSLIIAFALKPNLLLLDEPVNGLDFESTEFLYTLMQGYKEYGTILFSSHILESICLTSDRVLVLKNGTIGKQFNKSELEATVIREALNDTV